MKQSKIVVISLACIANNILAVEAERPAVKFDEFSSECLKQELSNKSVWLHDSSLENPHAQELLEHCDHLNQVQNDQVIDFIGSRSIDNNLLLDNWYEDIEKILLNNHFPQKEFFIEYWNDTLRNKLDITINGNKLRGYLDKLLEVENHPLLVKLGGEVQSILAEWELEKKSGAVFSKAVPEPIEEISKKFHLVFKKPVSVKGSHEKYLFRDHNGNLFKAVIVKAHGNKAERPKQEEEKKVLRQIESNLERKIDYLEKPKKKEKAVQKDVQKESSVKKRLPIAGDLAARLHKYRLSINLDEISIENMRDKNSKIEYGNEYYRRLPKDIKNLISSSFKKLSLNKENINWLDDGFENSLALFCYAVVTLQEQRLQDEESVLSSRKTPSVASLPVVESYRQQEKIVKVKKSRRDKIKTTTSAPTVRVETPVKPIVDSKTDENSNKLFNLIRTDAEIDVIKQFLDENISININYLDFENNSALMKAVKKGNIDLVKILLERFKKKIKLNLADDQDFTPLLWACDKQRIDIAEILLANGASLSDTLPDGTSALISAVLNEDIDMVNLLLKYPSKIRVDHQLNSEAEDLEGMSALMFAADYGHRGIAISLLKAGANLELKNCYGETPLVRAILRGHLQMVEYLLAKKARVDFIDSEGRSPLVNASHLRSEAAFDSAYPIMQSLLKAKANPNYRSLYNNTPSFFEISDDLPLLKLFLKFGADPKLLNKKGSVLTRICNHKFHAEINFQSFSMLSDYVDVDDKIEAITEKCEDYESIKDELIDMVSRYDDKSINIKIEYGNYVDRYFKGLNDRIKILLQYGADANARKTRNDSTAIQYMAYAGNLEGVKILLQNGADPQLIDSRIGNASDYSKYGREKLSAYYNGYLSKINNLKVEPDAPVDSINEELAFANKRYKKLMKIFDAIDKILLEYSAQ